MPWFHQCAARAGADDDYESLKLYSLNGRSVLYVNGEALRSRARQYVYAVDDVDLQTDGSTFDRRVTHLRDLRRVVESFLFSGQSIDPGMDMNLWAYRKICQVGYVSALVVLPAEQLAHWYGLYAVSSDAICFQKALLPARFPWRTRKGVEYWKSSVRFERRALFPLARFVLAQFLLRTASRRERLISFCVVFRDAIGGFRRRKGYISKKRPSFSISTVP